MTWHDHFSEQDRATLEARAKRVASAARETGETVATALTLRVRGEHYALPIEALAVVQQGTPVIPVPCVPAYVAGVANVRGHVIAVLDLGTLLDVPGSSDAASTLVVASAHGGIAHQGGVTVGLRVEAVGDVIAYAVNSVAPVPANLDTQHAAYLQGVLATGATLLDIAALLDDPALVVTDRS